MEDFISLNNYSCLFQLKPSSQCITTKSDEIIETFSYVSVKVHQC